MNISDKQHPSDLQVLDIQYQHVGDSTVRTGKIAILPPEYTWLMSVNVNLMREELPLEWGEFDLSITDYVDIAFGDTLEELVCPTNKKGFYILVTDELIQQLTPMQVFRLWEAVWVRKVELPQEENRSALTEKLWAAMVEHDEEAGWDELFSHTPNVLAKLGAEAMAEYRAGLTLPLNPDTL